MNFDKIPLLTTTAHEAYAELSVSDGIKIPSELEKILANASTRRKNGVIVTVPSKGKGLCGRYVGVEGTAWPVSLPAMPALDFGLTQDVETSLTYWHTLRMISGFGDVACLYINDQTCPPGFQFAGYDCGYYANEYDNFSAILHELLRAKNSRFSDFTSKLNAYGLFGLQEDALEFMRVVLNDGAFQEENGGCLEELSVIKVFVHVQSP